ncbi:MAG: RICIN domain-containing protein [Ruminococcus sp.]
MKITPLRKLIAGVLSAAVVITSVITAVPHDFSPAEEAAAVSADYAPQLMNLALYDDSKNLTAADTADKTSASLAAETGTLNEQWRIDYCGADSSGSYYKIVNAASGRLLTPYGYSLSGGTETVIYGNENDHSQYWYIHPVDKDSYGNDLHYKIVNYADKSMALTAGDSTTFISAYSGGNNQKWLLNCAGLQGFAGYSKDMNGNVKASALGGLLGPVVEVTTFEELKAACTSDTAETIVVTKNISNTGSYSTNYRGAYYFSGAYVYMHPNKTIIGSYGANSLYNVYFRSKGGSNYGEGSNFIIKNLTISHDTELIEDNIMDFACGSNIWVDHITFEGHNALNTSATGLADYDKFLCIYQDADFSTVSNCKFGLHEYGCLFGQPTDSDEAYNAYHGKPCVTIETNYFKDTLTRAPGLIRYGCFHALNNYVYNFSLGFTVYTGSKLYNEAGYYDGGSNSGYLVNDRTSQAGDTASVTYLAQYAQSGCTLINSKYSVERTNAAELSWRPSSCYSYKAKNADSAKNYCTTYSGAQSSAGKINYNSYAAAGVCSAGFMSAPVDKWDVAVPAEMPLNAYFMIKNANSGLYLDVDKAKAENGTNIQQWGASEAAAQNTWRFTGAGDGYYYIQSMAGDKSYVMDLAGSASNGTNICINGYKGTDSQKFMLTRNSDGTYKIIPCSTDGKIFVEISAASSDNGANCQLWGDTGSSCQDWILEEVSFDGEVMDTTVSYMFKNANSGLYMEVSNADDTDGANIQQWTANGTGENSSARWNSWTLKPAVGDLYYIVSNLESGKYITISDGNAIISAGDSSTNVQMMRFVKNPDGSYMIQTRCSYDKTAGRYTKCLEVAGAETSSGANIQQWDINGVSCQNWIAETVAIEKAPLKGDINRDNSVNAADAVLLRQHLLAGKVFTEEEAEAADINEDDIVDIFDMIFLRQEIINANLK